MSLHYLPIFKKKKKKQSYVFNGGNDYISKYFLSFKNNNN